MKLDTKWKKKIKKKIEKNNFYLKKEKLKKNLGNFFWKMKKNEKNIFFLKKEKLKINLGNFLWKNEKKWKI